MYQTDVYVISKKVLLCHFRYYDPIFGNLYIMYVRTN